MKYWFSNFIRINVKLSLIPKPNNISNQQWSRKIHKYAIWDTMLVSKVKVDGLNSYTSAACEDLNNAYIINLNVAF